MSEARKEISWSSAFEDRDIRYVAKHVGCTVEEVLDAIDVVGPDRARVIERLRRAQKSA